MSDVPDGGRTRDRSTLYNMHNVRYSSNIFNSHLIFPQLSDLGYVFIRQCGLVESELLNWDGNRLRVQVLEVSDTYHTEPTIARVSLGYSGYIWLDTKIELKKLWSLTHWIVCAYCLSMVHQEVRNGCNEFSCATMLYYSYFKIFRFLGEFKYGRRLLITVKTSSTLTHEWVSSFVIIFCKYRWDKTYRLCVHTTIFNNIHSVFV